MFETVLVPTDGSDPAATALDQAIALVRRFDAELHVLHVNELPGLEPVDTDERVGARELADRALEEATDRCRDADVPVETAVVETGGPTHEAILEYAADNGVDAIVMGTHGRSGIDRYLLGSVAELTLRESPVPVLTVHHETAVAERFEDVLVPTDGSEGSRRAAGRAIDLATAFGATLHTLYVVDVTIGADTSAPSVLDALEQVGQDAIDAVVAQAEAAGVEAIEGVVASGSPFRAIHQYVADNDVDVVVMGTHGRTGIRRLFLGSVTERVVRRSEVPVLSVPLQESDDGEGTGEAS